MRWTSAALLAAAVGSVEAFVPRMAPPQHRVAGAQDSARSTQLRMSATQTMPKTVEEAKEAIYARIKAEPGLTLPEQFQQALTDILDGTTACASQVGVDPLQYQRMLGLLVSEAGENSRNLFQFAPFHQAIRGPKQDYTKFGEEFFDILIVDGRSAVLGKKNLQKIIDQTRRGDNIVLLANHQTEPDPYILRAAFKKLVAPDDPVLDKLVFVAGAKVRTDLFTIPFSKGLNLICIHSKKYIEDDPATKPQKMQENLSAMKALQGLMQEGGHIIWVAPSGGRDRISQDTGKMAVAPFDPRACDMFRVLAAKSDKQTHFYPLSMLTYKVLPPPEKVAMEVGERRLVARRPVHLCFGEELTAERVVAEYVRRKVGGEPTDDQKEELMKKANKEGFAFVAEGDAKRNYDLLWSIDELQDHPETDVVFR